MQLKKFHIYAISFVIRKKCRNADGLFYAESWTSYARELRKIHMLSFSHHYPFVADCADCKGKNNKKFHMRFIIFVLEKIHI